MKNKLSSLSDLAGAFGRETTVAADSAKQQPADGSLVYSTESGRIKQDNSAQAITASDGFAKVRRETKGRKGKGVITISGLGIDATALKELAKKLKKTCGTGGSVVGEVIEVQGDKREQIKQVLETNGFKVKFVGG
ncbi:stress response translation initiation inhibitor YciH [Colwellia hornerae]|uniref:Stress response translation initiation inhibitor YciH n=1 Tax=Colwellia hornerae TaxID=89402 RepID=A0A5C6Q4I2_9GAMM|nr:stress response translation initiation inhibitor YciH [Colwellia hornerae]TWX54880.1 stress response translation initiation inhibitor YciH [Colwellia hornerae]TWX63738.1 stress response translation initiation inhibitor YciH [Colwellia hornerae]